MPNARKLFSDAISRCRGYARSRGFRRDASGAAAVDFALVLLPFLLVLMAIIETAMVLFASSVLDTATSNSARLVLTGQVQTGGWSAAQFKNNVCANLTLMFNCVGGLYIDVESFPSFSAVNLPAVTDSHGNLLTSNFAFSPGNPGDIVIVRLIYQWPILAYSLGFGLDNSAGHTYTMISSAAFRNEPY
jgi:Flp pilus assembly protein TadG